MLVPLGLPFCGGGCEGLLPVGDVLVITMLRFEHVHYTIARPPRQPSGHAV
jgi:hypothetical protein